MAKFDSRERLLSLSTAEAFDLLTGEKNRVASIVSACKPLWYRCLDKQRQGSLKGGDPAAGSPTATLLRLSRNHRARLRRRPPCGWTSDFGRSQLSWLDGRCVQGSGTYSPRRS